MFDVKQQPIGMKKSPPTNEWDCAPADGSEDRPFQEPRSKARRRLTFVWFVLWFSNCWREEEQRKSICLTHKLFQTDVLFNLKPDSLIDEDVFWRRFNTPVRRMSEMPAGERQRIFDGIPFGNKTSFSHSFKFNEDFFKITNMLVAQYFFMSGVDYSCEKAPGAARSSPSYRRRGNCIVKDAETVRRTPWLHF